MCASYLQEPCETFCRDKSIALFNKNLTGYYIYKASTSAYRFLSLVLDFKLESHRRVPIDYTGLGECSY
jgi:hypothetical protein